MTTYEIKKSRVVCCACLSRVMLLWWPKKHVYTPTITVEVHCRIRSFFCSLNYSKCFFSEHQNKLADSARSAYSSDNTKAWLGAIRDILFFCESLIRLFNRTAVDKTVL